MPTTYKWIGTTNAFATSTNFNPNGNPATGDTLIFDQDATGDLAGSDQSAITLAALYVYQGFQKSIGSTSTPLKIGATLCEIGLQVDSGATGGGPNRVVLDLAAAASTVVVYNTGSTTPDVGLENVRIKGSNASNAIYVLNGIVGIGTNLVSDTATFATISAAGGRVNVAAGVTWTTLTASGNAAVDVFAAGTTLNITGNATIKSYGAYVITTAVQNGGNWYANHRASSGASITTYTRNAGNFDCSGDPRAFTITTFNEGAGTFKAFSTGQVTVTTLVQADGIYLTRTVSLG